MSQNLTPQDLSTVVVGGTGSIELKSVNRTGTIPNNKYPTVVFLNESGVGLSVNFQGSNRQLVLPAGVWSKPIPVYNTDNSIDWTALYILPNSPVATLYTIFYDATEVPLEIAALGNSPIGISGNVATSNIQSLTNDGNPAPTQIIESTPSGQGSSSFALNNDGSGVWQILSANTLKKIINAIRGNTGTGKAVITVGDSGDATICTFYGSLLGGQPATVGALNTGAINGTGANNLDGGAITTNGSGDVVLGFRTETGTTTNPALTIQQNFGKLWIFGDGGGYSLIPWGNGFNRFIKLYGSDTTDTPNEGVRINSNGTVGLSNNQVLIDTAGGISTPSGFNQTGVNAPQELGSTSVANTPHLDFHSSGNNIDFDSRIIASGGTASNGQGQIEIVGTNLLVDNNTTIKNSGHGVIFANLGLGANGAAGASIGRGINGTETDMEITSIGQILSLNSDNSFYIKYNNYWNGTNDKFITTASGQAWQFFMSSSGPQVRFSTNTPTAGANITWSGFQNIASMASNGGGSAGNTEWVGTTDPGTNAGEGDIWTKA